MWDLRRRGVGCACRRMGEVLVERGVLLGWEGEGRGEWGGLLWVGKAWMGYRQMKGVGSIWVEGMGWNGYGIREYDGLMGSEKSNWIWVW